MEKKVVTLPTICAQTYYAAYHLFKKKKISHRALLVQCSLTLVHSNKYLAELCVMYLATFYEFFPK